MKYLKYYLSVLLVFFTVNSCNVLDEDPFTQPSTENFYQNETDALAALTASYARLKSGIGYYKQQFMPTLFASSDQGLSTYLYNEFKRGIVTSTNQSLNNLWKELYLGIRDANNVIAKVPDIDMNEELKNRIVGEAKFLRALHYFNLVRCFGEVPLRINPVEAGNDQGLPVSSIVEIYDLIIDDLNYASLNCWGRNESRGNHTNDLGRVTNTAAHALLAKVYTRIASCKRTASEGVQGNDLYLDFSESYQNYYLYAKEHCDSAISGQGFYLSSSLDDWVSIFDADNGNNQEMVFDVQGSSLSGQGTAVSNLFTPRNAGLSGSGFGGNNKLKPLFINNMIDKFDNRFQNSIITQYETATRQFNINPWSTGYIPTNLENGNTLGTLWQVWTAKYIDTEATTEYTSRQNWHVIRLADVYLMRAEANAEILTDPSAANSDINILRTRVEMNEVDYSSMSMDDFREEILKERAVELYMEGHRFFDLTRFGVYDEYCRFVYGDTDGARQAEDYTWPIPIIEVSTNSEID
jgi:hypothetical protein